MERDKKEESSERYQRGNGGREQSRTWASVRTSLSDFEQEKPIREF